MYRNALNLLASLLLMAVLLPACTEGPGDAPTATIGDAQEERGSADDVTLEEVDLEAVDVGAEPPTPEEAQELEVALADQARPGGVDEAPVYALTDDTFIGFTGYKIGGKHFGQVMAFDGSVVVPDEDPTKAAIMLEMDMTSAETDNSILTNTLQNEVFFNTEEYPTATFKSTKIEKADDGYQVTGNLTIRGTAKSVSFPAQIELEGDKMTALAEFTIDRNAWEIGQGWKEDVVIKDEVLVELDVIAQLGEGEMADEFSQDAEGSRPKAQ